MRLETRQTMLTVAVIVGFLSFGGCVGKPKEQTKPINNMASSSTKEDKEAIKQKSSLISKSMSKKSSIL